MRKVIGIGETVLDIIFRDDRPIAAMPGGSAYNACISLGRTGVNTVFISETGDDRVGRRIADFLRENNVDTASFSLRRDMKSPLSLAFLDEENNAEYVFYKDHPHDRLELDSYDVCRDDIVLFGSFFAINPVIRPQVSAFLKHAKSQGALLYYDVNFRASHQGEKIKVMPNIIENLELADFVRGSHEDFGILYGMEDADKVYRAEVSFYCRKFICTRGPRSVVAFGDGGFRKEYEARPTECVSTIGAGDNFNAGFIYGLMTEDIRRADVERGLAERQWDRLVGYGQEFAAECCRDIHNYVGKGFIAAPPAP